MSSRRYRGLSWLAPPADLFLRGRYSTSPQMPRCAPYSSANLYNIIAATRFGWLRRPIFSKYASCFQQSRIDPYYLFYCFNVPIYNEVFSYSVFKVFISPPFQARWLRFGGFW